MSANLPRVPDGTLSERQLVGEENRLARRGLSVEQAFADLLRILGHCQGDSVYARQVALSELFEVDRSTISNVMARRFPFGDKLLSDMYGDEPNGTLHEDWLEQPTDWGPLAEMADGDDDDGDGLPTDGAGPAVATPLAAPVPDLNDQRLPEARAVNVASVADIVGRLRQAADAPTAELADGVTATCADGATGVAADAAAELADGVSGVVLDGYLPATAGLFHAPAADAPPLPTGTPLPPPALPTVPNNSPFAPAIEAIDRQIWLVDREIAERINRAEKLQQARSILVELAA